MKNRCGYCESKTKDIVCGECLKEILKEMFEDVSGSIASREADLKEKIGNLEGKINALYQDMQSIRQYGVPRP